MPTGIFLRSGTQLSAFGVAVGYAFLYYLLTLRLGKELALAGVVPPGPAAWSTTAIFLVLGLVLLRRAVWR
jgi:lipopolysaccharide export LptBFGC system permease protein LptF